MSSLPKRPTGISPPGSPSRSSVIRSSAVWPSWRLGETVLMSCLHVASEEEGEVVGPDHGLIEVDRALDEPEATAVVAAEHVVPLAGEELRRRLVLARPVDEEVAHDLQRVALDVVRADV